MHLKCQRNKPEESCPPDLGTAAHLQRTLSHYVYFEHIICCLQRRLVMRIDAQTIVTDQIVSIQRCLFWSLIPYTWLAKCSAGCL